MSIRIRRAVTLAAVLLTSALVGAAPALAAPAAASAPPGSPPQVTPTERAAATARPAVVYLEQTFTGYVADETGTYFNSGSPYEFTASCTGFGVNPDGYVATAGHCVDIESEHGVRSLFISTVAAEVAQVVPDVTVAELVEFGQANWTVEGAQKDSPIDLSLSVAAGGPGGTGVPARVVDVRSLTEGDVALLKIETADLPSIELATDAAVAVGTPVLSIGYPASAGAVADAGAEPSTKDGQVSSKQTVGSLPVYETSAALTEGMSGGPSIGLDGRLLGVNSFSPVGESQAFNFIAPAAGLAELMARNGVVNELGPNDLTYRQALADHYAGRYTLAIGALDRLLAVAPAHEQAEALRTAAAKARERYGDAPEPTVIRIGPGWLLGAAGVVVAGGVLLVALAVRRRPARGPAVAAAPILTADAPTWLPAAAPR
ncbi:MAG: trypsin-like peptidase domain-containing protein [Pseudonocardia sp.]